MKILTVIGARPQFIKAIALSVAAAQSDDVEEVLLHTGQHYDDNMSEVFFRDLGLPNPKYRLNIGGGSHGEMTGRQLMAIEETLVQEKPDVLLVYGDTNSTLAGALAAAKMHIPVAHVEAGLRSFNKRMPEELNRILTDHVSRWLFAPTQAAVDNLEREHVAGAGVHLVGDVMYDVARLFIDNPKHRTDIAGRLGLKQGNYTIATLHRQENTDDPARLTAILGALAAHADKQPVVLPIHPRTAKMVRQNPAADALLSRLIVIEPVGFFDMATLLSGAALAVTDSGGLQKEAYFHQIPCVTVRDETEWVELVDMGWNRLPVSLEKDAILDAIDKATVPSGKDTAPYGAGDSATRILNVLRSSA